MRATGAALLGAAAVGAGLLLASSRAKAAEPDDGPDFDVDAEIQLASNYYAQALTNPEMWSDGQLKSLEGLLVELGMMKEGSNIRDMRIGLYGDTAVPAAPLPDITFIPSDVIDAIADQLEGEANA